MTDMDAGALEVESHGMRAPGTAMMVAGSLVAAVAAYLFQIVVGRALGDVAFAPVGALWTVLFILATILLVPLEQFATRETVRRRHVVAYDGWIVLGVTLVATAAGGGFVLATLDRFFGGEPIHALQMALMMFVYGALFVGRGVLAGERRFAAVGLVLALESGVRLLIAVIVVALGGDAVAVGWSMVVGGLAVFVVPFWRAPEEVNPDTAHRPVRFLGAYASGSAASQIMLAASPLAVGFLGGTPALFSIVFYTYTLFRAPLTLIYSLQGRLLSMLARLVEAGRRARVRALSAVFAGVGMVLTLVAWEAGRLAGPSVVVALLGEQFRPSVEVAGFVAAGMVAASSAQITGQVLVAEGRTGRLAVSWTVGLALALVMLAVRSGQPDVSVARAFALGETAALSLVGYMVLRLHRAPDERQPIGP